MIMGGAETVVNLRTEAEIQDYGKRMKESFGGMEGVSFTEVINGVKEYGLSFDESTDFYKAAKEYSDGKQTDYTIGKLFVSATRDMIDSNQIVSEYVGKQIIESNSVEQYVSTYQTAVESGAVFSNSINEMVADIAAGNRSPQLIGKFALQLQNDTPYAAVRGALVKATNESTEVTPQAESISPQQEATPIEPVEKSPSAFVEKSAKPITTIKGNVIGEAVINNVGTKNLQLTNGK